MTTYTITASETVYYQKEVEAESYEKALDLFVGVYFPKLSPIEYESFKIETVEEVQV
jgi:hypothetical protein